ncbi:MAG: ribose-phosphate diphosphokinase [Parachlamydiales bacterium]
MDTVLFAGSSHGKLAERVAKASGIELGKVALTTFPDGETSVEILEPVRDREVFVLQTLATRPNDYLMELLILVDALSRASAGRITVVLPYFAYARQDRKGDVRAPITARLVADLLEAAGADHVVAVDLHAEQIQGFFRVPLDNLHAARVLLPEVKGLGVGVVVSPDVGSIKIARRFALELGCPFATVDKVRGREQVVAEGVIGDVAGKVALLCDDMCTTGGTLVAAAEALAQAGAKRVYAALSHGLFVGTALEEIGRSPIERLFVTDTVAGIPRHPKVTVLPVAPLLGEALARLSESESLSTLLN